MLMMLELGGSSLKNCKEQAQQNQQNVFSAWVACIHLEAKPGAADAHDARASGSSPNLCKGQEQLMLVMPGLGGLRAIEAELVQLMLMMLELRGSSPNLCKEEEQLMLLMLGPIGRTFAKAKCPSQTIEAATCAADAHDARVGRLS